MDPPRVSRLPIAWMALLVLSNGCTMFNRTPDKDYRTVEASETRDTDAARKHHDHALDLLAKCDQPCCCECVAKMLCSPCRVEGLLQDALVADVRFGPAHNTLGTLYYRQHKFYLAAWEFEYASRLMPNRPEPLNNLGLVYEESGKVDLALELYHEAVSLAPDNAEYLGNLARAQMKVEGPDGETRYWLEQVVFHDSRGDWVEWAQDSLGENKSHAGRSISIEWEGEAGEQTLELLPPPPPSGPELTEPDAELLNPLSQ